MMLPVNLTKEQVKNSPDIDTEKPVTRQHEDALRRYYDWPLYWGGFAGPAGTSGYWPTPAETERIPQPLESRDRGSPVAPSPAAKRQAARKPAAAKAAGNSTDGRARKVRPSGNRSRAGEKATAGSKDRRQVSASASSR